jgi:hypothetical protein
MTYCAAAARSPGAPFFSLARALWVPYVMWRDAHTGEFHRVEGPRGFASYREAMEASRFLVPTPPTRPAR